MNKINCFKCRFFKTTWNLNFPRSCTAYGFKTKEIPSSFVLKVTGSSCMQFSRKYTDATTQKKIKDSNIDINI